MDFTVKMKSNIYFIVENAVGGWTTENKTLVFLAKANDKIKCTVRNSDTELLVFDKECVTLILESIDRIHPYNVFNIDKENKLTRRKEIYRPVIESNLSEIVEELRRSLYD